MASQLNTSLLKASLQRLLAVSALPSFQACLTPVTSQELEFLHTNKIITDEAHAAIQESLAPARDKLKVAKFVVTCTFTHEKKGAAELHVEKGQVLEVLDDDIKDWYMGRVRGGDGVIGWAPKNKFRMGE
ncbi:hypothetical protein FN846DRAFT_893253 [Sphaerosporella brunnea]|uniref:SH3 domain-containing protein n=1 Tax=Sphaerosporella brunnea TaxID=1250544 RepID=A0A5J5ELY3_9PEZI|nr:hypothetical protein FN846DRAFT_893253 [Sphaerosporella brunnea]